MDFTEEMRYKKCFDKQKLKGKEEGSYAADSL